MTTDTIVASFVMALTAIITIGYVRAALRRETTRIKEQLSYDRLVVRCGACEAILGMIEPVPSAPKTPLAFCSWSCMENRIVARERP